MGSNNELISHWHNRKTILTLELEMLIHLLTRKQISVFSCLHERNVFLISECYELFILLFEMCYFLLLSLPMSLNPTIFPGSFSMSLSNLSLSSSPLFLTTSTHVLGLIFFNRQWIDDVKV